MDRERYLEARVICDKIADYQFLIDRIECGEHVLRLAECFSGEINSELINQLQMYADEKVLKVLKDAVNLLQEKFDKL